MSTLDVHTELSGIALNYAINQQLQQNLDANAVQYLYFYNHKLYFWSTFLILNTTKQHCKRSQYRCLYTKAEKLNANQVRSLYQQHIPSLTILFSYKYLGHQRDAITKYYWCATNRGQSWHLLFTLATRGLLPTFTTHVEGILPSRRVYAIIDSEAPRLFK